MINVNALNQAINALRAETQLNAISPNSLGGLLQQISNLLATATTASDLDALTQLQIQLNNLKQKVNAYVIQLQNDPTLISHIVQGAADRNNVYLDATKVNVAFGTASTVEQAVTIKQATTERAGVMRAQQVSDLNDARNNVAALQTTVGRLQTLISEVQTQIHDIEQSECPFFHIECKANMQDGLHVIGATDLVAAGFVPYIFRYSRKKSRYRYNRNQHRRKGPKMRGWHVFCGVGKIKFQGKDLMMIARHNNERVSPTDFYASPQFLFSGGNRKYDEDGNVVGITIGYGCDEVDVTQGKRFRFAVAFSRPQTSQFFDFTKLVTNMAEFGVFVKGENGTSQIWMDYHFSR